MTLSFLVEYFEVTGVLDMAPRGMIYVLRTEDGADWAVDLSKYRRPRRFLGRTLTVTGPRCGERVIKALRLYVHDDAGDGYWLW